MISKFDLSEQLDSQSTRRTVVATGVKLAYAAPIVAASLKVSALSASAAVTGGGFCGHSTGTNGGCKGACTTAGFTGDQCNEICGNGQFTGACPVGQGGDNPCCNPGYCDPANFEKTNTGAEYTGPTTGCPPATSPLSQAATSPLSQAATSPPSQAATSPPSQSSKSSKKKQAKAKKRH